MDYQALVKQAPDTIDEYAMKSLFILSDLLGLDMDEIWKTEAAKAAFRKALEPFAPVWAAMITACERDYAQGCTNIIPNAQTEVVGEGLRRIASALGDTD